MGIGGADLKGQTKETLAEVYGKLISSLESDLHEYQVMLDDPSCPPYVMREVNRIMERLEFMRSQKRDIEKGDKERGRPTYHYKRGSFESYKQSFDDSNYKEHMFIIAARDIVGDQLAPKEKVKALENLIKAFDESQKKDGDRGID